MRTRPVQRVLLVGGGSGMGRASAEALASLGLDVFVADRDPDLAGKTAKALTASGGKAWPLEVDIGDAESVGALFHTLKARVPSLDLLVHSAAILGKTAFIEDILDEDWHTMLRINLDGVFYVCRETVRWMKETGGGRLVLFSSVASLTPTPGALPYSAAKGGVTMFARSLAAEVARHNIRVNVIAPGYVETPMLQGLPQDFAEHIVRKTPLRRLGKVGEIASLVAWLASVEADFMTGQVLSPNGGLVI